MYDFWPSDEPDHAARARRVLTFVFVALAAAGAVGILYSAACAFTAGKFKLMDYGTYTNMLWNTGHGRFFRVLVDDNYLGRHLSFSLAILGPLFRLIDHPFLLAALQWLLAVTGVTALALLVRRAGARAEDWSALLVLGMVSVYAQAPLLSEFHGITLSMVALPALYAALRHDKRWVLPALVFFAGLREEHAFLAIPLLLYFAVKDRWRAGYVYAALALVYGVLALKVLYPLLNGGAPLSQLRGDFTLAKLAAGFRDGHGLARLVPFAWMLAPLFIYAGRRGWAALLVIPSAAFVHAFASPLPLQHTLRLHYSAALFSLVLVALAEVMILREPARRPAFAGPTRPLNVRALLLTALVLAQHCLGGFIWFTRKPASEMTDYRLLHAEGLAALRAAAQIPRTGILLCSQEVAGFCANRADLMVWRFYKPERHALDAAFFRIKDLGGRDRDRYLDLLDHQGFGVTYLDRFGHVVAVRGAPADRNAQVRQALDRAGRTILFARTGGHGGRNVNRLDAGLVRYWDGRCPRGLERVSEGGMLYLTPGHYTASFNLRVGRQRADHPYGTGSLAVRMKGSITPLASAPVTAMYPPMKRFQTQTMNFWLDEPSWVEVRVTGGDTELWLDRVAFDPVH